MSEARFVAVSTAPPDVGAMVTVEVEGAGVTVANIEGTLRAFDDLCTHRACALSGWELRGETVICPCHRSGFDLLTGATSGGPAHEPIRIRDVRVEGDELLVEA